MTEPVVTTRSGAVRGEFERNAAVFKGIPYAAPPVGENRFRAPHPPQRWDGVRDALTFSATAPQADLASQRFPGLDVTPLFDDARRVGDDYLTVNVWTPDPGARGLPVMVWIYGGAFVAGASSTPLYNGASFARDGVIFVSFNYRVGIEGYLPLAGGDTNIGLRDQIAALTWVQENIAAFGGDPSNVTIFGESSGALSVATLMAAPYAQGLFRRAISQSGGGQHTLSVEQAQRVADRLGEMLGVSPTRENFAARSFDDLIAAQTQLTPTSLNLATEQDPDPTGGLTLFMPVRDGDLIFSQPVEAIRQGASAQVDLLAGANVQEMDLYYVPTGVINMIDSDEKAQAMLAARHPDPAKLVATYRASRPSASPGELFSAIMTDWMFGIPTVRLAEAHTASPGNTHVYEFAWQSPACEGKLGACHGLELGFVFDALATPKLAGLKGLVGENPPEDVAWRIHRTWTYFAKTGNPGWPSYSPQRRDVMRINTTWELVNDPWPNERAAWDGAR